MVAAADREATIRSGMAIDMAGNELNYHRPWFRVDVKIVEQAFRQQLLEVRSQISAFCL